MRIGIDVGGTNTDAVLMEKTTVVAKVKTADLPGGQPGSDPGQGRWRTGRRLR